MTVSLKRLLMPRIATCAAVSPGAVSSKYAVAVGPLMAPRSQGELDRSPSERLQVFAYVDPFRHDADVEAEIGEGLQVVDLFRRHVLDHDIVEHRHAIDHILGRQRVLEQVLARL